MAAKIRSSRSNWARRSCVDPTCGTSRKSTPRSTSRMAPQKWGAGVVGGGNWPVGGEGEAARAGGAGGGRVGGGGGRVFLGRGGGGGLAGRDRVVPARNGAPEVGGEPLLLARTAPTIVARDRVK